MTRRGRGTRQAGLERQGLSCIPSSSWPGKRYYYCYFFVIIIVIVIVIIVIVIIIVIIIVVVVIIIIIIIVVVRGRVCKLLTSMLMAIASEGLHRGCQGLSRHQLIQREIPVHHILPACKACAWCIMTLVAGNDSLMPWWLLDNVACITHSYLHTHYIQFYTHSIHADLYTYYIPNYVHCKLCMSMQQTMTALITYAHRCACPTHSGGATVRMTKAVFRVRSSSHTCRVHGNLILNTLPNAPGCVYSGQSQWHHFIFWLYHPTFRWDHWLLLLGIANSATQTAQMVHLEARCMTAVGNEHQHGDQFCDQQDLLSWYIMNTGLTSIPAFIKSKSVRYLQQKRSLTASFDKHNS